MFINRDQDSLFIVFLQSWVTGDIIGAAIDCDEGKVTFTRFGVVAVDNIHYVYYVLHVYAWVLLVSMSV